MKQAFDKILEQEQQYFLETKFSYAVRAKTAQIAREQILKEIEELNPESLKRIICESLRREWLQVVVEHFNKEHPAVIYPWDD